MKQLKIFSFLILVFSISTHAQPAKGIQWQKDGNGYYANEGNEIVQYQLPSFSKKLLFDKMSLTPAGKSSALAVRNFFISDDGKKLLIYTNSKKVWRYETKGDYWLLDNETKSLKQLGKTLPASSLMFAKLSPDGKQVAYVSGHNVYVEDIATGISKQLTTDGTAKLINGTFDWVYEEEFGCRDGFRWSPDSRSIAYWQIDATKIRNYLMLNTTDSIYSFTVPVEYPKVGEDPSSCKIGVVDIATAKTRWMNVPGDAVQHYIPRMEWAGSANEIIVQQLNRKQQESKIMLLNAKTGDAKIVYEEADKAWIDIKSRWHDDDPTGWEWINNGQQFLWVSEKDGWRHIYVVNKDGRKETLATKGDYDMISLEAIDEKNGFVYFMASPNNALQQYLYRSKLDGTGIAERVSPAAQQGTHAYQLSPNAAYAKHNFSSAANAPEEDWVKLPTNEIIKGGNKKNAQPFPAPEGTKTEFIKITTDDGVTMDGWKIMPDNFDSTKKYPVVFYVYSEPGAATVADSYGAAGTFLYNGDIANDGYIQISLDGRGTPAPKGAAWRKSIYKKVGILNIRDQAMAAKKILEWKYVDKDRIAVWGWSGGGSTTLNLMFQYPEIYKTGIAIAPVANRLCYDNIYEERYMGLPKENKEDYIKASAITHAKGLKGNLLVVHGTGDDNVHYQNTEMLINELVKNNKQFSLMSYPNRTHSINEGRGTSMHLVTLFTNYLKEHCPGGGR